MRHSLAKEILAATEEAVQALRIDHSSALFRALEKRERLIAELFGLDSSKPLPGFNASRVNQLVILYGKRHRDTISQIHKAEETLFLLFEKQLLRLKDVEKRLRNGHRWVDKARGALEIKAGSRIDRTG